MSSACQWTRMRFHALVWLEQAQEVTEEGVGAAGRWRRCTRECGRYICIRIGIVGICIRICIKWRFIFNVACHIPYLYLPYCALIICLHKQTTEHCRAEQREMMFMLFLPLKCNAVCVATPPSSHLMSLPEFLSLFKVLWLSGEKGFSGRFLYFFVIVLIAVWLGLKLSVDIPL